MNASPSGTVVFSLAEIAVKVRAGGVISGSTGSTIAAPETEEFFHCETCTRVSSYLRITRCADSHVAAACLGGSSGRTHHGKLFDAADAAETS